MQLGVRHGAGHTGERGAVERLPLAPPRRRVAAGVPRQTSRERDRLALAPRERRFELAPGPRRIVETHVPRVSNMCSRRSVRMCQLAESIEGRHVAPMKTYSSSYRPPLDVEYRHMFVDRRMEESPFPFQGPLRASRRPRARRPRRRSDRAHHRPARHRRARPAPVRQDQRAPARRRRTRGGRNHGHRRRPVRGVVDGRPRCPARPARWPRSEGRHSTGCITSSPPARSTSGSSS